MAKKKRKQFRDFESSAMLEGFKEPYVCITKSMLTSEKWANLNYSSKLVYLYMKLWSYGRQEFKFSYSLALNIVGSKTTYKKSIDELVANGFTVNRRNLTTINLLSSGESNVKRRTKNVMNSNRNNKNITYTRYRHNIQVYKQMVYVNIMVIYY